MASERNRCRMKLSVELVRDWLRLPDTYSVVGACYNSEADPPVVELIVEGPDVPAVSEGAALPLATVRIGLETYQVLNDIIIGNVSVTGRLKR